MMACLLTNSVSASAELTSGVSKEVKKITVKGAVTDKGEVVGATVTTAIYETADIESTVMNIVVQNQIVRTVGSVNGFYKIKYGDGYGYVQASDCISGDDLARYIANNPDWFPKKVKVTTESTNLYDWLSDSVYTVGASGDSFQLKDEEDDYYIAIYTEVQDTGEEVNTLVRIKKSESKLVYSLHVTSFSDSEAATELQMDLVEFACQFVGNPYVWGGTDPNTGADCSGFVQYVFNNFGIELPRTSAKQALTGEYVDFSELQPGDLIFYQRGDTIGHVALYIGDGQVVQARGKAYGICITRYDYSTPAYAKRVL